MTLVSTLDLLYLTLAIAALWIAVFLCWGLYELARLLHQANMMVSDTREKMSRIEKTIMAIKEKIESSVNYLGILAEGGKAVLSMLHKREDRKRKKEK